ncbi:DUF1827 family protein [Loigolactobacillus backii]|uniref:Uncharacterized protein n=1 Tax=Loigolactobacillus backii TaxID=375175 RepID=A0A192GZS1_9LACO|nr:DUF1827 family protein [Loigolactobacillus backii]ANK60472.1 hypothetical protein AYR52_09520 [Loigolactobacillus backii]ANK62029.1 hypothetical protein AYR53_04165 [Loigolactobacillus backii]ANK65350.1 hypothetical protein AYR54_08925 [Loigolactobacillus backii]ANK67902.1 hypothetical protein AYR55_09485 [Loigolactobacillus backii]ANK68777.1 hypothetical protein AYR56_00560 [Loigolactobacillus backii]
MKLIEVPIKVNVSLRKMIPNTISYLYGNTAIRYFRKYTLGNTSVYYVDSFRRIDVILTNTTRNIRTDEIDFVVNQLLNEQTLGEVTRLSKEKIEAARHHKIRKMKDIVIAEAKPLEKD